MATAKTLLDKIWETHVVCTPEGQPPLLFIDLHLVHEVTSPQAFEGLREAGRKVRRPDLTFSTVDHNLPTTPRNPLVIDDPISRKQIETLRKNVQEFGIKIFDVDSEHQGIVHVIGPELGLTLPGKTIVCGDSHTSTHGAFGALAFGIGTSEVEHVLATQCLPQRKPKTMKIAVSGALQKGVTAKDLALAVIGKIGTDGATGYVLEYQGAAIDALSMDGRLTLCNMSIEAGARAALIPPDETTFAYIGQRPYAPKGEVWEKALQEWKKLHADADAVYDATVEIDAAAVAPQVTWGTSPGMVVSIEETVPDPLAAASSTQRTGWQRALEYMGLTAKMPVTEIGVDRAFIGSCTNGRLEDLREAAAVAKGYKVKDGLRAMVVPGSQRVKMLAEREGLDKIFLAAGFEWRESGCSMCLGMNPDTLNPGERCASTSNRNFEGRQGRGGRTHLVSPAMAAAAAITGHFTDIRRWEYR